MVKKYCSESVLPGHTILKLERQALQSNPRPQGHRGLHRMLSRGRRSCSCWIASSTDEDLNDLHFALNDRVDRPVTADSDAILPWIRPFDGSNVGLRPRSKRVLLEDTQTLHDAGSRSGGEFAQLPSRCLRQRDPERHTSSNGMNSSSSRMRFHRASSSLIDALSISCRMTSS